ncbi:MAG TPA: cysteine-rich CWC family protein [Nitrospirales bacterium]|nr:cysteine-rich CWC family protein [Nitrospirales bacterium]
MATDIQKSCERCGGTFLCRQDAGCWCGEIGLTLPQLAELRRSVSGCVCPDCLMRIRRDAAASQGV